MKFLVAVLVFIATLGLTTKSIATEEPKHEEKCSADSKACGEVKSAAHEENEEAANAAKMSSLFPTKQKNAELGARPATTEITAPSFLATVGAGSVKLEWKAVPTATDYHVQVATDPNFKWLVANEKFVKGTSFDFKAEAGKRYFWRVASFKGDNNPSYTKSNFVGSVFNVK
ncbi:MAG: fibronectin type III domain-containing protein [Pseudobdellovibrio sp.]